MSSVSVHHVQSLFMNLFFAVPRKTFKTFTVNFSSKELVNKLKLKGRKKNSHEWLLRQMSDPYVRWANVQQFRCRSAFKLMQMDEKLQFLFPGMCVVDCGAAPGSWSQVLIKKCNSTGEDVDKPKGTVISIDLSNILDLPGATVLSGHDFTTSKTQNKVEALLSKEGGAHAVVSDMAPSATGMKHMDHEAIANLAYSALRFSVQVSRPGAVFLVKLWDGHLTSSLQADISKFYSKVKIVKPDASRSDSSELFLFANQFKGLKK